MKKCPKCKQLKFTDCFGKNKSMKDGLQNYCKTCHCESNRKWANSNPKKALAATHKWRKNNPEYGKSLRGVCNSRVTGMRLRCENPDHKSYSHYGARGIAVRFTIEELYNWCVKCGVDPFGREVHRIDNDGDYALDNIEFLTKDEHLQAHLESVPF